MTGMDLWNAVHDHPDLEWLPCDMERDEVRVLHVPTRRAFAVPIAAVLGGEIGWDELLSVLTGAREPEVLTYVTRIVGYFSNLNSWNRSKLAELRDRGRGDYGVPARSPSLAGMARPEGTR